MNKTLTNGMIKDIPLPHSFLYLHQLQSHTRTNLRSAQYNNSGASQELLSHCFQKYHFLSTPTSVRRTALCWDAMLPRPEQACGSSVMLSSPSCSASLSERFAPLRKYKTVDSEATNCLQAKHPLTSGRLTIAQAQEPYFISSSLMSSNLFMFGNLSCISFLTPRLMPTGTTFRLLQVGNTIMWISVTFKINKCKKSSYCVVAHQCVYFEHTSLNSQVTSCHHLSPFIKENKIRCRAE